MQNNDDSETDILQACVSPTSLPSVETDTTDTNEYNGYNGSTLDQDDPLRDRILTTAIKLFESKHSITIQDVVEAMDITESPIRFRLGQLVEFGKLVCLPGAGRRPSYYFLPEPDQNKSKNLVVPSSLEALLQVLESKEASIQENLNVLQAELEILNKEKLSVQYSIEIQRKYEGPHT